MTDIAANEAIAKADADHGIGFRDRLCATRRGVADSGVI
jgi:hypothetical protein